MRRTKHEAYNKEALKQRGASLMEYTVLVALISFIGVGAMRSIGKSVSTKFSDASNAVSGTGFMACTPGNPGYPGCLSP